MKHLKRRVSVEKYYNFDTNLSTVWITVNRACNFRCKWCYAECSEYKIEDDMPLELAKRIADLSINAGAKHIILIGGEPTMWKHVFDFSKYCREKAISCGICKLNINTELQIAWTNAVREFLSKEGKVYDPRKVIKAGEKAIKEAIFQKLEVLGSKGRA